MPRLEAVYFTPKQAVERLANQLDYPAFKYVSRELHSLAARIPESDDLVRTPIEELVYKHQNFTFYPGRQQVNVCGEEKKLSPTETQVLLLLASHVNLFVSREEIVKKVWNTTYVTDSSLKQQLHGLRNKLSCKGEPLRVIETRPHTGVRLIDPSKDTNIQEKEIEQKEKDERMHKTEWFTHFPEQRTILKNGSEITLTPIENNLLDLILRNHGRTITYRLIEENIETMDGLGLAQENVKHPLRSLRQKLGLKPNDKNFSEGFSIQTFPNLGIRFVTKKTTGN